MLSIDRLTFSVDGCLLRSGSASKTALEKQIEGYRRMTGEVIVSREIDFDEIPTAWEHEARLVVAMLRSELPYEVGREERRHLGRTDWRQTRWLLRLQALAQSVRAVYGRTGYPHLARHRRARHA